MDKNATNTGILETELLEVKMQLRAQTHLVEQNRALQVRLAQMGAERDQAYNENRMLKMQVAQLDARLRLMSKEESPSNPEE